jgi:hypothetical protein
MDIIIALIRIISCILLCKQSMNIIQTTSQQCFDRQNKRMVKAPVPCSRVKSTSKKHGAFADVVVPIDVVPLGSHEDPCVHQEEDLANAGRGRSV